jgi:Domain of unknown function (DUF4157)
MSLTLEPAQSDRDLDRKHPDSASDQASLQEAPVHPLSGAVSAFGADGSDAGNSKLVSSPLVQRRGNGEMRTLVMRRLQQGAGNHRTQQLFAQSRHGAVVQRECSCGGACSACQEKSASEEEESGLLQREATTSAGEGGMVDADVIPTASPGEPLDRQTRNFMEPRFGTDFSDVRIHTDASAAQSADTLGANAYTTGRDIYFAAGKYAPGNINGKKLLAHELAHTVQQQGSARRASEVRTPQPPAPSTAAPQKRTLLPKDRSSRLEPPTDLAGVTQSVTGGGIAPELGGHHSPLQRDVDPQVDAHSGWTEGIQGIRVSHPNDPLEREAAEVSEQIVVRNSVLLPASVSRAGIEIARQDANTDTTPSDSGASAAPLVEPFEGAKKLANRSSVLDLETTQAIKKWADACTAMDLPWSQIIDLKLDIARVRREKLLVDTYFANASLAGKLDESADDVINKCQKAAYSEEETLQLVEGVPAAAGTVSEITSDLLLKTPELFPEHVVGLYRSAVEEFEAKSKAEQQRAESYLTPLLTRPPEGIIPDYVWMIENERSLQDLALEVGFVASLDADVPVMLEKKQPNSTSLGIDDIRAKVNEHQSNFATLLNPLLGAQLDFLYQILEAYYFWQFYGGLAELMQRFQMAVQANYERLNEPFSSPDVIKDLNRSYSNTIAGGYNSLGHLWVSQLGADEMRKGYWWISGKFAEVLDAWVGGLSWFSRIWEGFGLYDVSGEMGKTLKSLVSLEAILKMVGFVAFIFALQLVPFGNLIADAIMIAMLGKDVLEGLLILGEYFDAATDATSFRGLYSAAQRLKGFGQVAVSLLLQLTLLAAGKGLGAYVKYRRGLRIKDIDEVAEDPALKEGPPSVQKAVADAKAGGNVFSKWKDSLSPETQALLDDPANTSLRKMWAEMDPVVRSILTKCASDCIPRNATEAQATQIKVVLDRFGIRGGATEALLKDYFHARRDILQSAIDEVSKAQKVEDLEAFASQSPIVPPGTPSNLANKINAFSSKFPLSPEEGAMLREYFQVRAGDLDAALSALEKITAKSQLIKQLRDAATARAPAAPGTPTLPSGRGGQYQHAIIEHGAGETAEHMTSRARTKPVYEGGRRVGVGQPIGQWYNNNLILEADERFPGTPGEAVDVNFGRPVGRVFLPDGLVVSDVTWVRVVRNSDGSFSNAFPVLPPGVQY